MHRTVWESVMLHFYHIIVKGRAWIGRMRPRFAKIHGYLGPLIWLLYTAMLSVTLQLRIRVPKNQFAGNCFCMSAVYSAIYWESDPPDTHTYSDEFLTTDYPVNHVGVPLSQSQGVLRLRIIKNLPLGQTPAQNCANASPTRFFFPFKTVLSFAGAKRAKQKFDTFSCPPKYNPIKLSPLFLFSPFLFFFSLSFSLSFSFSYFSHNVTVGDFSVPSHEPSLCAWGFRSSHFFLRARRKRQR